MNQSGLFISRVRFVVADAGDAEFFTVMKEALEASSDLSYFVSVETWHSATGGSKEAIECRALFTVSSLLVARHSEESITARFQKEIERVVGTKGEEPYVTIVLLHENEMELILSFCDAYDFDPLVAQAFDEETFLSVGIPQESNFKQDSCRPRNYKGVQNVLGDLPSRPLQFKTDDEPPAVKKEGVVLIGETDEGIAEGMSIFLFRKAARQDIGLTVVPHNSVEDIVGALEDRQPLAISISPHLLDKNAANGGKLVKWGGLRVIPHATKLGILVVLSTHSTARQVRGALNRMSIKDGPSVIVSPDSALVWVEKMMSYLIRSPH